MKASHILTCISILGLSTQAFGQITAPKQPVIELLETLEQQQPEQTKPVELQLQAAACGVQSASWIQTSGPTSAELVGAGPNSIALLSEQGDYQFELNCCIADATNDRVARLLSSPDRIGFGASATGGAAADSYTVVTSLEDSGPGTLRDALLKSGPRWIIFDEKIYGGTIFLKTSINVREPDVTIDGAGAEITISPEQEGEGHLLAFRGGNSIIHGISIDGRGFRSTSLGLREGKYYWADHITITGNTYDDGIAIGQASKGETSASEVTISNYKVFDTNYGVLGIGPNNQNFPPYRATIHSSDLGARDRNPRIAEFGTVHVFNNYIHSFRFSGITAAADSTIFSQNNVFSALNANNPKATVSGNTNTGGESGVTYTSNDLYTDSASWRGDVRFVDSEPFSIPYQYTLLETSEVKEHVLNNAGADKANLENSACQTYTENYSYTTQ